MIVPAKKKLAVVSPRGLSSALLNKSGKLFFTYIDKKELKDLLLQYEEVTNYVRAKNVQEYLQKIDPRVKNSLKRFKLTGEEDILLVKDGEFVYLGVEQ